MAFYDYTFVLTDDGTDEMYFGANQVIWAVNLVPAMAAGRTADSFLKVC